MNLQNQADLASVSRDADPSLKVICAYLGSFSTLASVSRDADPSLKGWFG